MNGSRRRFEKREIRRRRLKRVMAISTSGDGQTEKFEEEVKEEEKEEMEKESKVQV